MSGIITPTPHKGAIQNKRKTVVEMTKLEYLSGLALQGLLSNPSLIKISDEGLMSIMPGMEEFSIIHATKLLDKLKEGL